MGYYTVYENKGADDYKNAYIEAMSMKACLEDWAVFSGHYI
jgi:hypothetical protein